MRAACQYGVAISIHAPARGATSQSGSTWSFPRFQSTHPHGVRRLFLLLLDSVQDISIHAPARGATAPRFTIAAPSNNFNPRTRTGCDVRVREYRRRCDISIHAPARGATRGSSAAWRSTDGISIHAPARGATGYRTAFTIRVDYFNPRTRTGCDVSILTRNPLQNISIHAPARGATAPVIRVDLDEQKISIHAPARGATASDII